MATSPFHNKALEGRVALVTGGGSGIGLEIAEQLVKHGARAVVLMGRRLPFLEAAAERLRALGGTAAAVAGDVRREEDATRAVEAAAALGGLDILVNSAAGNFLAAADQLSTKGFRTVLDIDAVGVFNMSRAALPHLRRSSHASIVNISATLHYGATWWQAHASAAKAAIDSLTRSLALEWGGAGVRVNGIAPGPIAATAGMTKLAPGADGARAIEEQVARVVPLGRMGTKWDVAMAAVYLCSDAAAFVTGDTIVVDGAHYMYRTPAVPRELVGKLSRAVEGKSRKVGGAQAKL